MKKIYMSDIRKSFSILKKYDKYIFRYWRLKLFIFVLSVSSILFSLITPYIGSKGILDKGILGKNMRDFIAYTLVAVLIFFINMAISNVHRYLTNYVIRRTRIDVTRHVLKKLNRYSLRYFFERSAGNYIFRVCNDIESAVNIINDTVPSILDAIFRLVLITGIILFINWKIMLLVLVYQFFTLLRIKFFVRRSEKLYIKKIEKSESVFKKLSDIFSHIYIIKALGTMTQETRRYFHGFIENIRLEFIETKLSIAAGVLGGIYEKVFFGVITFYGSILVIKGEITLGTLGAAMIYMGQGVAAYTRIITLGQTLVFNSQLLERISILSEGEIDIKEKPGAMKLARMDGGIEFREVYFGYHENSLILNKMSFSIPQGCHAALVGPSGCGKTTIINMILRLYEAREGKVLIDGIDIRDIKFESIHRLIGVSLYDPFLWNDTIAYNISYGIAGVSGEDIRRAARIAMADGFILRLPDKYNFVVGDMACAISEGQRQRIAIARAVVKKPDMLILDEAMSSLDSDTEESVVDNLKEEFRDSTIVMVSHRMSTVRKMDLVYFVESPSLMSAGSHEELLMNNIKYRELFASQVRPFQNRQAILES